MEPADKSNAQTRTAGRGVLSITFAKLYFIVAGYALQLTLPRLLGSPEQFGLYSAAMSVVSILNNVLIVATIQTLSKRVSEDPEGSGPILRQGLTLQLMVGLTLAGALFGCAPILAERVLLDPLMSPLFRVASVVVFSYAVYAALVGSLNGRQLFVKQAGLDVTYTTLRTSLTLGAAGLGFGVVGAVSGFAAAAACIVVIALFVVGLGGRGKSAPLKTWLMLMAPLWLYQLCLNLTLQVDLTVLKRTVAELAMESGVAAAAAAETASRMAGFYRAAQTFAFVPYQLILSVTLVVFPMVSRAVTIGDALATRRYIAGAMRFSLIVLCAIAAPVSGASAGVMRIAYPDAYLAGSQALSVLALGMVCFALFVIGSTILSGAGKPGLAAVITLLTVLLVVGCNLLFVRWVGVGDDTLWAAASGTSVGTTFALFAVGGAVQMRFGAFLAPRSTVRVLIAGGVAWMVSHSLPSDSALGALLALVGGGIAYLSSLALTRELSRADMNAILAVVGRRA